MLSRLLIAFMAVYGLTNVHAQAKQGAPGADLIVHNAKIFTGNPAQPEASALAVKDGRIYSVGTDAEVLGLKNDTKMALHGDGFIRPTAATRHCSLRACANSSTVASPWP